MPDHGTGAIQDPIDDRDIVVSSATLKRLAGAIALPAKYRVPIPRPPVTDQGLTPQCVAYSSAYEQNYQDHREHGRFYNFDENTFFYSIGGSSNGAVMRYALDEMLAYGYPESGGANARQHRISGYFGVSTTDVSDIKRAIANFGGVLVIMQWFQTWEYPSLQNVLPAPGGSISGHAIWLCGWDDEGNAYAEQSWGTAYGENGFVRIPWGYITRYAWNIWKTADEVTLVQVAKAKIDEQGAILRKPGMVIGDGAPKLSPKSIWGKARRAGIYRNSTDSIVYSPWDHAFRFYGFELGTRHGIGKRPNTWAVISIPRIRTRLAVPAPQVRLVSY